MSKNVGLCSVCAAGGNQLKTTQLRAFKFARETE